MARMLSAPASVNPAVQQPPLLQLCVILWAVGFVALSAGQESRYYIDPRPPSPQQFSLGTFAGEGGGTRSYGSNRNGVVQPAMLKPMDSPPDLSVVQHESPPLQSVPPVLLPLSPPPLPPPPSSPMTGPASLAPAVAPINSRRQSICYECPGPYACKTDFLWASCDADCIKIDGTVLSERYLPERAKNTAAVQGEFRGCFSDRKWSEYLNVIQPNTCAYFEYTKDFPYVHGTVCRCGLDFCNSAVGLGGSELRVNVILPIVFFLAWLLKFH